MGAGASRKYVVEEIRAATQADVARACAELSTQDKDKLIVLLEASEQVAQFIEQLAATIRTRRRRRRRRPIGRSNWSNKLYCVHRQWHTCLSSLQSSQKRPTPTFSLNTKGGLSGLLQSWRCGGLRIDLSRQYTRGAARSCARAQRVSGRGGAQSSFRSALAASLAVQGWAGCTR